MNRFILRIVLLGFYLSVALAGRSWAWGDEGHQIVCGIAYLLLQPGEQTEVNRLTNLYRRPDGKKYSSFAEGCTFPDFARTMARDEAPGWTYFVWFSSWHFLNVPRGTRNVQESHCGDNCILKGIDYHSQRFADHGLEDWKRAESLFFLGHWLGDVHQPLHVGYADDAGGNDIQPILGGYYPQTQLHAIWDAEIIRKALDKEEGGWWGYTTRLKDRITPALRDQWLIATPLQWAQESYNLTTTDEVDYCKWESTPVGDMCGPEGHQRQLNTAYQALFQDAVETRLQQAGVRLAARIRAGLNRS